MFGRIFGLLLFLALMALIGLNFKQIMDYSVAMNVKHHTDQAVEQRYWNKAISEYETARKDNPHNHPLALRLGWIYLSAAQDLGNPALSQKGPQGAMQWRMEQAQKAEATYRDVLKDDPDNLEAQMGLASAIQMDLARTNEAVDVLRHALKKNGNSPLLLNEVGNVYKRAAENPKEHREKTKLELYGHAREYYALAVKLNPESFQGNFNLGVAYQNLNNSEMAAVAYCKAITLMPDSYEARYNLGLALVDQDYLDEGYRQMDKAVDLLKNRASETDMRAAQKLAGQIQHVKAKVFNSDQVSGLDAAKRPDLPETCLLTPPAAK